MPELAELRLTADYINTSAKGLKFVNIIKNPSHKGKDIYIRFSHFTITAESRGKELMLTLMDRDSHEIVKLLMTMGMSGHFQLHNTENTHKHAHLSFISTDGVSLSFVDVRRFGKWKISNDWSPNRGPDPINEFAKFKENVLSNLDKAAFDHPIHLVLMNQQYFNGIGNYLRSEVLYRLPHINPWDSARSVINGDHKILTLCSEIPKVAYILGGGQLKDWKNPNGVDASDFYRFMKCYGNPIMSKIKDKNGRTFWYDSKWNDVNNLSI